MSPAALRRASALEAVRARIERDYARALPLDALASAAGCSPFHLLRAFRRRYGVTPRGYQERLRLARAQSLLREHATTITAIAVELGYAHHSHFSAAFRRAFGVTPSDYRDGAVSGARR